MIPSKKLRGYASKVFNLDLVSGMNKSRVIKDLSLFGVRVDENSTLTLDVLRVMYYDILKDFVNRFCSVKEVTVGGVTV